MPSLTFYAQVTPKWNYYRNKVVGLALANATNKKPARPLSSAKVVKVVLTIPESVFIKEEYEVHIDVPESHIASIVTGVTEPIPVEVPSYYEVAEPDEPNAWMGDSIY